MAIQLPNGKISRTLPEQVGYLTAKLEEVIKTLNESDIVDKVINLTDSSGFLSSSDAEIAELWPAYIKYGGLIFIKVSDDGANIDFYEINVKSSTDSGSLVLSKQLFRVVKSNYAFSLISANIIDLSAIQGAVGINGDVVINGSIKFSENYYEYEDFLETLSNNPSLTYEKIYTKASASGNKLTIVFLFKLTNETGSASSAFNSVNNFIDLDEEIASKIYNSNGESLNNSTGAYAVAGFQYNYSFASAQEELINVGQAYLRSTSTANRLQLTLRTMPAIADNTTYLFEGRIELLLS